MESLFSVAKGDGDSLDYCDSDILSAKTPNGKTILTLYESSYSVWYQMRFVTERAKN